MTTEDPRIEWRDSLLKKQEKQIEELKNMLRMFWPWVQHPAKSEFADEINRLLKR